MDYVKPYFTKVIGKKTIEVMVNVTKKDGIIEYMHASSEDLIKIDAETIYVIRSFQLNDIKKQLRQEERDNIFMHEETLDISDIPLGNIDDLEKELLFSILESMDVRNEAQLRYLSELQPEYDKLMLTVQPQFGFVFTIRGKEMNHYIWELINSHATYL